MTTRSLLALTEGYGIGIASPRAWRGESLPGTQTGGERNELSPPVEFVERAPLPVRTGTGRRGSAALTQTLRPLFFITFAALLALCGLTLIGQAAYIHAKALLAQVLLERAFTATLATGKQTKPWSWADTWPVARIAVPRLGEQAIVLAGASGQALAFGPGHVEHTPEPGEPGTAIYSAHRDTHFAFLKEMRIGDQIVVTRRDGAHRTFRVTQTSVVRWDASGLDPLAPGRHLVLATCWPFSARTTGPLRYLVHAELVDEDRMPA
jgi:sortase A